MLIDIQNSIKAAESKGYEQWAKIHNLKQAAKTLNFLTEHDISEYEQLQAVLDEVHTESENTAAKTLQAARNGGKLPDFKKLHTEYKELTEKKDKLYQEYGKLKKKVKQYDTIKQNVDSILRQAKQPEREKQTER